MKELIGKSREFVRQFGANFYIASGLEKTTHEPLRLLWSGPKKQFSYFGKRIFASGNFKTIRLGRRPLVMSDILSTNYNCSVSLVLVPKYYVRFTKHVTDVCLPLWVDCHVELSDKRTYATCESIRGDLRRIRKHQLFWARGQHESELRQFYKRIYWPTVTSSHGEAVLPASAEERLRQFSKGKIDLIRVICDGQVIAGVTIDYRERVPVLREVGVLDGASSIKKMGAVTAANLFAMDYLVQRGYTSVNLGLSRTFLDDGVLNYKRKFMPAVNEGSRECVLLGIRDLDDPVRSLLRSSACISWQDGNLHRTYFRDISKKSPGERPRRHRSEWLFGIADETVFDVSGHRLRRLQTSSDLVPA